MIAFPFGLAIDSILALSLLLESLCRLSVIASPLESKQTAIAATAPGMPLFMPTISDLVGNLLPCIFSSSLLCGAHSLQSETQTSHKFSMRTEGRGMTRAGDTGQVLWRQKLRFKQTPFWVFALLINHHAHCYLGNSFFKIRGFN